MNQLPLSINVINGKQEVIYSNSVSSRAGFTNYSADITPELKLNIGMMTKKIILHVDDDIIYRRMFSKQIERSNIQIITCSNINTAAKFLQLNDVDLLVLDIEMPSGDGWELAKRIRVAHMQVPIIMLTSTKMTDNIDQLENVEVYTKPLTTENIQYIITKYLI